MHQGERRAGAAETQRDPGEIALAISLEHAIAKRSGD
jgi:hypothetical protein